MKFSAKTYMKTATFRDLSLGRAQGTLVEDPFSGYIDESNWLSNTLGISKYYQQTLLNLVTYFFFMGTVFGMCTAIYLLCIVSKETKYFDVLQKDLEESLTTMKNDFEQRYNNQEFGRTATKPEELHEQQQQQQQWSLPSWAGINSSHTSTKKNDNNKNKRNNNNKPETELIGWNTWFFGKGHDFTVNW